MTMFVRHFCSNIEHCSLNQ